MSRPKSVEGALRDERAANARLRKNLGQAAGELALLRTRVANVERELAEWKARFDLLLRRDQK